MFKWCWNNFLVISTGFKFSKIGGIFGGCFWQNFFWWNLFRDIFWEDFFGRIFWEDFWRIFWEDFFGRIFGRNVLEGIFGGEFFVHCHWLVCASISHLKKQWWSKKMNDTYESNKLKMATWPPYVRSSILCGMSSCLLVIAPSTDKGRPMKPFFIKIPNFWYCESFLHVFN